MFADIRRRPTSSLTNILAAPTAVRYCKQENIKKPGSKVAFCRCRIQFALDLRKLHAKLDTRSKHRILHLLNSIQLGHGLT